MEIGPLNTRCRIEKRVSGSDPTYGTELDEWEVLADRWCNIQDQLPSRSESIDDAILVNSIKSRLRLRYCTDVDTTMRIVINRPTPGIYQIISGPAILGDKDGVEFMLEKISTDGN